MNNEEHYGNTTALIKGLGLTGSQTSNVVLSMQLFKFRTTECCENVIFYFVIVSIFRGKGCGFTLLDPTLNCIILTHV